MTQAGYQYVTLHNYVGENSTFWFINYRTEIHSQAYCEMFYFCLNCFLNYSHSSIVRYMIFYVFHLIVATLWVTYISQCWSLDPVFGWWACLPSSYQAKSQQYFGPSGPTASIFYWIWITQSGAMGFILNLDKVLLKKLFPSVNI